MNVGQYTQNSQGERLPLLDPKMFKQLQKKGVVTAKMLACREINSPGKSGKQPFHGLAMDFKGTGIKFAFLARFDRFDIAAFAKQAKSEETDDWIGETFRFILRKSTKGQGFVNAEFPKGKK